VWFANRDKNSVQATTILIKLLKAYAAANTKNLLPGITKNATPVIPERQRAILSQAL
jgi:hypothetical protein